jgi:hypothetical protein
LALCTVYSLSRLTFFRNAKFDRSLWQVSHLLGISYFKHLDLYCNLM